MIKKSLRPRPSSPSSSINKRVPLLAREASTGSCCTRFKETAGTTTAECAAILCCCPCGLVNFLVLAAYKVPAGLCRRALKQRRRKKLIKQGLLEKESTTTRSSVVGDKSACYDEDGHVHGGQGEKIEEGENKEVMELELEMWDRFLSTGFWRSLSQRDGDHQSHDVVVVNGEV